MSAQELTEALECTFTALQQKQLQPVDVAILDSGVDATHPDLASRQISAFKVECEDDKPPTVRDVPAATNNDVYGHGTAVASIIANIAPNARFIDMRVLGDRNLGTGDALIAAVERSVKEQWRIINMSLAASASVGQRLAPLCERAYYQNQVIVAARRNQPIEDDGFPAEFSSSIGVDLEAFPTPFEYLFRTGRPIEYVAQGDQVRVAAAGGGYTVKSGTSFATPAISGLCALLLGAFPKLRQFELKTVLKAHAARLQDA
jgi:subtilisin family serine protease